MIFGEVKTFNVSKVPEIEASLLRSLVRISCYITSRLESLEIKTSSVSDPFLICV